MACLLLSLSMLDGNHERDNITKPTSQPPGCPTCWGRSGQVGAPDHYSLDMLEDWEATPTTVRGSFLKGDLVVMQHLLLNATCHGCPELRGLLFPPQSLGQGRPWCIL